MPRDSRIDRRHFLAGLGATGAALGGAALGGAALLGSCSSSGDASEKGAPTTVTRTSTRTTPTRLLDLPASSTPITNIVVLMQENRSFDHWYGWLADDDTYREAGKRRYGSHFDVAGDQRRHFTGADGEVATTRLTRSADQTDPYRGCGFADPGHSWEAGRAQRDHGFLAPGSGNDTFALGYYTGADLPFSGAFASRFGVCDHSFASLLASTFPNRMYLHAAQSDGRNDNTLPTGDGLGFTTIWDRLTAAGVSCAYYYSDLPVTFLWGDQLRSVSHPIEQFFDACEHGTLPSVTFVDPGFLGATRTDNHPMGDIHAGERFARDVFSAFARSAHWAKGVFISTYDEWGGFFDHVAPPVLADDRASSDDAVNFGQAGFRVPTVVASPFVPRGSVDHTVYDHTSILRFIEWRFLGAPATGTSGSGWWLTERDRNAANIASSLVTDADADLDLDLDTKIPAATPACAGDDGGFVAFSPADAAPTTGPSDMERLVASGWFDRFGLEIRPSAMASRWVDA